jgi:two-component system phosphate regulon response regulator PhoB
VSGKPRGAGTVTFTLPRIIRSRRHGRGDSEENRRGDEGTVKKLLIADDEEGIRRLVRMTLESEDYEILEAADGDEALELARLHHPALILLDVMMPRRSGLEVCRTLKKDPETAEIKIFMLTARAQESDQKEGEAAGCDGYFMKPFSPIALMRRVDEIFAMIGRGNS